MLSSSGKTFIVKTGIEHRGGWGWGLRFETQRGQFIVLKLECIKKRSNSLSSCHKGAHHMKNY